MVTLTGSFARKAGVAGNGEILLKTANGTRKAATGNIPQLSVGRLKAADVAAAILPEDGQSLGNGIDGLLGMSFLSRYKMEVTSAAVTLSPHCKCHSFGDRMGACCPHGQAQKPNPTPPVIKLSATDKMIQDAVQKAKARKKSGETDDTWRKEYAASLKVPNQTAADELHAICRRGLSRRKT